METRETPKRQRGMTPMRAAIPAAGSLPFFVSGDYLHVYDAPVNDLVVRFDDGEPVALRQGLGLRRYYDKVTLESATGQVATVLVGFGSVADARATANVNVTANVTPGANFSNGGDVACGAGAATLLLAADAARLYALIGNASTNTITVRIGTAAVAAASGIPLEPGTTLPVAFTGAIYAWNPGGVPVTINAASVKT